MQSVRSLPLVLPFVLALCPSIAFAKDWVVAKTTSQVSYTVDKTTWEAVAVGVVIPSKAWISTGPRGRVTLTRGEESLSLSPNTLGSVVTHEGIFSRKTEVVQQTGEIALDIEKRSSPHTYVHTPFLAAVVKGTTFTVTVTQQEASVAVESGLVQVSSFTGGETADVGPGQQATVDQNQTMSVAGVDAAPSVTSVEPTRANVPAVNQAAPLGAGLGLSAFGDQSAQGSDAGSNGVAGESGGAESSVAESSFSQSTQTGEGVGSAGGNSDGSAGNLGNSGHGHGNENGHGNGSGNGNGNGNGHGKGNGNGNGPGNGPGNGHGPGHGNGHGHGHGNGNGHGHDDDDDD